ncbi:MAG TPA: rhomboid family protein [Verrucomicrobiae bacterium]|nr:rhomboid family protein [Verrucomicrobiae bacterium]
MIQLHQQSCLNHATREAVARCPECGHFYCRECIAEHDDRVICAACLRKLLRPAEKKQSPAFRWLLRAAAFGFSLMTAWLAFYVVGKILLSIPVKIHDGTLWHDGFLGDQ